MIARVAIAILGALVLTWALLIGYVLVRRPTQGAATAALRVLPDTIRLLRRIAADRTLHRGIRIRLWLLLGYLVFPIDLVPDFLPLIGYADDIVIVGVALRSVLRGAGPDAVRRHWPGTDAGLQALWSAAGLPGEPPTRTA